MNDGSREGFAKDANPRESPDSPLSIHRTLSIPNKKTKQALQEGWTRDETQAHAQREGLPFLKSAHLTDWVLGTVARCVGCFGGS